jgi:hypothetical protein
LGSSGVGKLSSSPSGQQVFSSAAAPSAPQQARSAQAGGPAKGSGFTGVGRFLQANVGSRLGEQVAGRVAQAGQQAQQRLGEAVGRFQTGLGKERGTFSAQEAAAQSALQRFSGSQQPVQTGQAVDFNPSQDQIAAYLAASSGQYAGPSGLEDIEKVRSQAGLAQALAGQTQTTKGRTALLQQLLGRGSQQYTKGQTALDALLLGQSSAQLAQSRRGAAGLEKQLETQERLAEEQARQAGEEFASKGRALKQEAGAIEAPLKSSIQTRLSDFEKNRTELISSLRDAIEKGELTKEQADILGIKGDTSTYGLTTEGLKNLITSKISAPDINVQSISTPEEAAKLNALFRLTGRQDFATQSDLQRVGSLKDFRQDIQFDPSGALEKAKAGADKAVGGAQESALERPGIQSYVNKGFIKKDEQGRLDPESIRTLIPQLHADPNTNPKLAAELDYQKQLLSNYLNEYDKYYSGKLKIK